MFSASTKRRTQRGTDEDGESSSQNDDMPYNTDTEEILRQHRICNSKYTHFHIVVFVITFSSYGLMHANRKSFSNVKKLISSEWTPSFTNSSIRPKEPDLTWNDRHLFDSQNSAETFLGSLDTAFMVAYACGLYISGFLGDRFNLRYVICLGMVSTSITIILFAGVSEWLGIYEIYWYMPFWILNGLFQSTAWPSVVAVMGHWFGKSHRGFIFGIWSATASVGNIWGSLIVAQFVNDGYDLAMMVPAAMLFGGAIVMFFGLVVSPKEVGLPSAIEEETSISEPQPSTFGAIEPPIIADGETEFPTQLVINSTGYTSGDSDNHNPVSFCEALLLPGVIVYSLAYACLKLVNYSFFFWLPYYLTQVFHWSQAVSDTLSVWYDFGGIIGGIVGGFISDRLKRAPVMLVMLLFGIPALFFYRLLPNSQVINGIGLGILGFFIGGVANIMSAAVCADLGRQPKLRGNTAALATVTGILDGTGSAGAAVGQILIPILNQSLGWGSVFYMFIICTALTAICILPIVYRETRDSRLGRAFRLWCWQRGHSDSSETSLLTEHVDEGLFDSGFLCFFFVYAWLLSRISSATSCQTTCDKITLGSYAPYQ